MKNLLIGIGVATGLLLIWMLAVGVHQKRDREKVTSSEITQFKRYLGLARRELARHSMEETGELANLSREFTTLAQRAQGDRSEEFRAYALYFKEFVDLNRERANAAGIMKDVAFHHFGTITRQADLDKRHEQIARLQLAIGNIRDKVEGLEPFVCTALEERGMQPPEAAETARQFATDLQAETQFVIDLCSIHSEYAQNMSNVVDLLIAELGYWAARNDGTVIFRRQHAFDGYGIMRERSAALREADRALRQQNFNEASQQVYR